MNHLDEFNRYKNMLFAIAYRMLGSVMDSEDILQEAFLRWQNTDLDGVKNPKSFLSAVAVRLCIDFLRSARQQREEYIGPWLPEPLETAHSKDLDGMLEMNESVSMAFMVLLEKLSPVERAVFLLREVFDFDYSEISEIVEKDTANCRQIMHRAGERVLTGKSKYKPDIKKQEQLFTRFLMACQAGDLNSLIEVLEDDITLWSDGGGKVQAARIPVHTSDKVARFINGVLKKAPPGMTVKLAELNGQPGVISYVGGKPFNALILDMNDEKIKGVYIIANPDKLRSLS